MCVALVVLGVVVVIGCETDTDGQGQSKTGSLSITAGFGPLPQGFPCSPNTNGMVTFRIEPAILSGEAGISETLTSNDQLAETAQEVDRDIDSGAPIYGCQASHTFFNLKPGTWLVRVSGATGHGSCRGRVSAGASAQVKIWRGCIITQPSLTVITANMANATPILGVDWKTRIDRFADHIDQSGLRPDLISLTESAGLWRCSTMPDGGADDYDTIDRLIRDLRQRTDVRYRVAYMIGMNGSVKNFAGTETCWYFSGDTLLYNPARIRNVTLDEVAGRPQSGHIEPLVGSQVRRSLPLCRRGSTFEPLETLIDGPSQVDRCNVPTPSGPAWAQIDRTRDGDYALVASLGRFSFVDAPGSSFDIVTSHPPWYEVPDHRDSIEAFVTGLTEPPFRTGSPYLPLLVMGDLNDLDKGGTDSNGVDWQPWPAQTTYRYRAPGVDTDTSADVMVVAVPSGIGPQAAHTLTPAVAMTLPGVTPCRDSPAGASAGLHFSDHCGLLVSFWVD
jgi:hypothetical protein